MPERAVMRFEAQKKIEYNIAERAPPRLCWPEEAQRRPKGGPEEAMRSSEFPVRHPECGVRNAA